MNLRQAQRSLAELISKCEAAHIQLPEDPLEARAEAVESIIHSLKDGRPNMKDAQEELQQKFGIELEWRHYLESEDHKRLRRCQTHQKRPSGRGKEDAKLTQDADGESTQYQSSSTSKDSRTATLTQSKQPTSGEESDRQEAAAIKVAKKAESSRELIVPEASEEKLPAVVSEKTIRDNHDESVSSGSRDQEMIDLLEDLDENDGGSDASSDEDEELCNLRHSNSG